MGYCGLTLTLLSLILLGHKRLVPGWIVNSLGSVAWLMHAIHISDQPLMISSMLFLLNSAYAIWRLYDEDGDWG